MRTLINVVVAALSVFVSSAAFADDDANTSEQAVLTVITQSMNEGVCPTFKWQQAQGFDARTMRDISLGGKYPQREVLFAQNCRVQAQAVINGTAVERETITVRDAKSILGQ